MNIKELANEIKEGKNITRNEALKLLEAPLEELTFLANEIRNFFCKNNFDICTIINAKSGQCPENCKFCVQSRNNDTELNEYSILSSEQILAEAKKNAEQGILRFSIVTAGKRLSDLEIDKMCEAIRLIKKDTNINICASMGLLNFEQFKKLKEAGVSRIHNNLETSKQFFPKICTTHTFADKLKAIKTAQDAGLSVCSGGIMGLGESSEDRIDMAFLLRELGIKSIPINMLNPIKGTPLENNEILKIDDMKRIIAIYRFILPKATIRLAGGRGLLEDKGESCFLSGANAAISGDMLTTAGITVETDKKLLEKLDFSIGLDELMWNKD